MSASAPQGPPSKHQPTRYFSYFDSHFAVMQQLMRTEFVGANELLIERVGTQLSIAGQIGCKGHLIVDVTKDLVCHGDPNDPNPIIETVSYSYDVLIQGHGNIFRADNFEHVPLPEGHRDAHHRHVFDWPPANDAEGRKIWVGAHNWPTLGEVIFEALEWHSKNFELLVDLGIDPQQYATSLRSGPRHP